MELTDERLAIVATNMRMVANKGIDVEFEAAVLEVLTGALEELQGARDKLERLSQRCAVCKHRQWSVYEEWACTALPRTSLPGGVRGIPSDGLCDIDQFQPRQEASADGPGVSDG